MQYFLSSFSLCWSPEAPLPQPGSTRCLARGRDWHMSWVSHLRLLSPPKWECIQNTLLWKHILSIQVPFQDLTIKSTSRIFKLGSSWMKTTKQCSQCLPEGKEDLGWKQVKALASFRERQGPMPTLPSRWSNCIDHWLPWIGRFQPSPGQGSKWTCDFNSCWFDV